MSTGGKAARKRKWTGGKAALVSTAANAADSGMSTGGKAARKRKWTGGKAALVSTAATPPIAG
jgi:hypothetical protein